jgi:dTDP-4-amino-4,6-dideoxygalactose transaminase
MIPLFKVRMPELVIAPLTETLLSGYLTQGPKVDEFERQLADKFTNNKVLTVNTGTSAIHLALRLAGVGAGDEVITTPMTCTATNMPIMERGGQIVWADIQPDTGNIDPKSIRQLITAKTKAIICVHWGGTPCDMDEILGIAKEHGIKVIEDAAHAFGACYKGQRIGSLSDFTCFSFQAIKHLTTIDGGALACKHIDDYRRGKLLRWYGIDRDQPRRDMRCEEDVLEYGYKFHMNDVAATIGIEQLKTVDEVLFAHRRNAFQYDDEFDDRGIIHCQPLRRDIDRLSSFWLYTILIDDRNRFIQYMMDNGVQTSRVHARNDKHTCFKSARRGPLPGLDEFERHQCSIPVGWWLSQDDRDYIMDLIERWDGNF